MQCWFAQLSISGNMLKHQFNPPLLEKKWMKKHLYHITIYYRLPAFFMWPYLLRSWWKWYTWSATCCRLSDIRDNLIETPTRHSLITIVLKWFLCSLLRWWENRANESRFTSCPREFDLSGSTRRRQRYPHRRIAFQHTNARRIEKDNIIDNTISIA